VDLWQFIGIISSVPPTEPTSPGSAQYNPTWFPGTRLNYAENLLWRKDDGIALTAISEIGPIRDYSYRELNRKVAEMAASLRVNGLSTGDRVAGLYLLIVELNSTA
jgi:acetoacetyl-CoA synthetase